MKFPVYPFSDVLRALRNEADLTVLRAAEVTRYDNYERWESGQTRVGPDHLENIAVASAWAKTSRCWCTPGWSTA